MHHFIRILILALILFIGINFSLVSLFLANISGVPGLYIGDDPRIDSYNAALSFARNGIYTGALTSLDPLIQSGSQSDTLELYGDLLYATDRRDSEIISAYERSLAVRENPRVRSKIDILRTFSESGSITSQTVSGEISEPINPLVLTKSSELQDLQKNPQGALDLTPSLGSSENDRVLQAIDILGGGVEKRDW